MSTVAPDAVDALVVGGGPAGLSAAVYLARYNRSVLVLDNGSGRSTHHQVNHNYLGFPDGISARDLRANGRAQLAHYPAVQVVEGYVDRLARTDDGVTAWAGRRVCRGRVVVLATGVLDHYPEVDDWESYVGTSMFWCITCDGWENKGREVLVLGHTDTAATEALQLHTLTDRVRLLTDSPAEEISAAVRGRLATAGIEVVHERLISLDGTDGRLRAVRLASGRELSVEALFCSQRATPQTQLAEDLGVELDARGYVLVDTEQRTSVVGVFAAGDVTALHSHQVTTAVHEGAQAASAANHYLYPPELKAP